MSWCQQLIVILALSPPRISLHTSVDTNNNWKCKGIKKINQKVARVSQWRFLKIGKSESIIPKFELATWTGERHTGLASKKHPECGDVKCLRNVGLQPDGNLVNPFQAKWPGFTYSSWVTSKGETIISVIREIRKATGRAQQKHGLVSEGTKKKTKTKTKTVATAHSDLLMLRRSIVCSSHYTISESEAPSVNNWSVISLKI